jgi:small subunit ribosomal protein S16
MLAIRLARVGAKKQAAYRVVVMEKSRARNSRSVEILGHYNPRDIPTLIDLKQDRIEYWLGQGAQPSERVSRLLKVYKERPVEPVAEKPAATKSAAPEKPAAEAGTAAGANPGKESASAEGSKSTA